MITGDNPLTAVHVARDVEIVDRDALILDLKENATHEAGMLTVSTQFTLSNRFVSLQTFAGALWTRARSFQLTLPSPLTNRSLMNTISVLRELP